MQINFQAAFRHYCLFRWRRTVGAVPTGDSPMALIRAEHLVKTYRAGEVDVPAVKDAHFTIEARSFVAFVGPSGSGKSTLLNMIGCLDRPTGGKLTVLDTDVSSLDRRSAAHFRGSHIGFVFQDFNLIPVLTV